MSSSRFYYFFPLAPNPASNESFAGFYYVAGSCFTISCARAFPVSHYDICLTTPTRAFASCALLTAPSPLFLYRPTSHSTVPSVALAFHVARAFPATGQTIKQGHTLSHTQFSRGCVCLHQHVPLSCLVNPSREHACTQRFWINLMLITTPHDVWCQDPLYLSTLELS